MNYNKTKQKNRGQERKKILTNKIEKQKNNCYRKFVTELNFIFFKT